MIPTRHDYYRRRAREHRLLATRTPDDEVRQMHERLVSVYTQMARDSRLRQTVSLRPEIAQTLPG